MSTVRQFLDFIHAYEKFAAAEADPEAVLRAATDDQLHQMIIIVALNLRTLRDEAVRRGKWDDWKKGKVPAQ